MLMMQQHQVAPNVPLAVPPSAAVQLRPAAAPIGKHQFLVDRLWRANTDGLEDMFRVKWVGWKSPEGDTVVAESGIFPDLVELFRACETATAGHGLKLIALK